MLIAIGFLFRLPVIAQAPECADSGKQMRDFLNLKRYNEAAAVFEKMPTGCALNDETIFADSETVLDYIIKQSKNEETKKAHIQTLIGLYDQYDKAHPQNTKSLPVKKAMALEQHKAGTEDQVFALLDKSFQNDRANFTNAQALYRYFELLFAKNKAGDKAATDEVLYERYDNVSVHLNQLAENAEDKMARRYRSAANGIRAMMAPMADCGKLTAYYENEFPKRTEDAAWLESVAKGIYNKKCGSNALFRQIAEKWYAVAPSASSAENLALISMRNGQKEEAIKFMEQAVGFEKDPAARAQLRYNLAIFAQSDKEKAVAQLKKAIEENPKFGRGYLLLAQTYANSTGCAKTPFETKTLNLLAAQTVRKAVAADPGMKATAEKQAADFIKKGPSADEIKNEKMGGKTVSFGCWINETVSIPK